MTSDFIVVGAGTAGCAIAAGLIERGHGVTLIEAGGSDRHPHVRIPAAFPKLFESRRDWAFRTVPQPALGNRRVFWPRGRMVGGSSAMNAQIHQWCNPADFDAWEAAGAQGWGRTEMLAALAAVDPLLNGGALRDPHPLSRAFVEAAARHGLAADADCGRGGLGPSAWLAEVAQRGGMRHTAADAWLRPALRKGLRLERDCQVLRVTFTGQRATGVTVRQGNAERTLAAAGGVILAAGAVNSPHLLMLSGIGPAADLAAAGIAVRADRGEVGRNLQDHLMLVTHHRTARRDTLKAAERPASVLRYLFQRRGMLASNVAEAVAFAASKPGGAIDLELVFAPALFEREGLAPPSGHGFSIAAVLLKPRSRGRIGLAGPDPLDAPLIDPAYLSDPAGHDLARLAAGVRLALGVAAEPPLADEASGLILPQGVDDAAIRSAIRDTAHTIYHPVGTCRMGRDPASVVDCGLRVRGVEGLWVADASVMPEIPAGHPNAVVAAIAHRFARTRLD